MVPAGLSFCNWFLKEEDWQKGHSDLVMLKERYCKWATHKWVRKFLWNSMTVRIELRLGSWRSSHKDPSNNCHLELVSGTRIWWECKFCCVSVMWYWKGDGHPASGWTVPACCVSLFQGQEQWNYNSSEFQLTFRCLFVHPQSNECSPNWPSTTEHPLHSFSFEETILRSRIAL